jgi:hypothetical protein
MSMQVSDQWHHMYTGLILILISLFLKRNWRIYTLGIGIGLFIDEIIHIYCLFNNNTSNMPDYFGVASTVSTLVAYLVVVVIIFVYLKFRITDDVNAT